MRVFLEKVKKTKIFSLQKEGANTFFRQIYPKVDLSTLHILYISNKSSFVSYDPPFSTSVIGCVGILPLEGECTVNNCVGRKPDSSGGNNGNNGNIQPATGRTFELKRMIVHPTYHGRGVAQLLLQRAEHFAFFEQGGGCIELSTSLDTPRACRFYEKCGYEFTKSCSVQVRDFYPDVKTDIVVVVVFYEKDTGCST